MNNNNRGNNNNNNRRRGRGNNRPQGGGGRGEQLNRIDSRARGNAPQLLEKYKKLAQDAHLNGDRVTAEYYLQFADHYFRVIADARQRQEEQRQRRDERPMDDDVDDMEFAGDSDFPAFDQPFTRREDRRPQREEVVTAEADSSEGGFEPAGSNPFTRDNHAARGLRPRSDRRERAPEPAVAQQTPEEQHGFDQEAVPPVIDPDGETARRGRPTRGTRRREPIRSEPTQEELGLDPSALPPAIEGSRGSEGEPIEADADAVVPAPRRRGRRPKAAGNDAEGGSLEAVNG